MLTSIHLRIFALILGSILAIGPSAVRADPSALVHKFMSEPATLWDLGMYRLETKMGEVTLSLRDGIEDASGSADFDWDKNKFNLNIRFLVWEGQPLLCKGRDACERFCAKKLERFGSHLYPKFFGSDKHFDFFASFFHHSVFIKKNFWEGKSDEEAASELSKLATLRVEVQNTVCTRDLRGGPISFTKAR
jgi:hypothetical protein